MKERTRNLLVGLTVMVALVVMGGMILVFQELPGFLQMGYRVKLRFPGASGITEGSDVLLAGRRIGRVTHVEFTDGDTLKVGGELEVSAALTLGSIEPEHVAVELFEGPLDSSGQIRKGRAIPMRHEGSADENGSHRFAGKVPCHHSGHRGCSLRIVPHHPDLGDVLLLEGDRRNALERYEEAADLCQGLVDEPTFPEPWAALANRGWAEFKLGRRAEGRRSLELAQEYRPNYWPAMLSLAVLESEEGRRMQAISLLQEVIELGPGPGVEAEANYRLAENYIALGKRDRAVGHLTTAVARAPDGEWARRSEAYLKLLR